MTSREKAWSTLEQQAVLTSDAAVQDDITGLNRQYEERFGYRFVICALGLSSEAIAVEMRRRLRNGPVLELTVAKAEIDKIAELRIERLFGV